VEERRDYVLHLIDLLKVRSRSTLEIPQQARVYLADELEYDADATAKHWKDPETSARLSVVRDALDAVEAWEPAAIEAALRAAAVTAGVGFGKVAQPLRIALTGSAASPGIDQVGVLLGRERTLARIDAARERLALSGAQ